MKKLLTITMALLAIVFAGCRSTDSSDSDSDEKSSKLSPAAKTFCDYLDDISEDISSAETPDEFIYATEKFKNNHDKGKLKKYRNDKITAADKKAMKKAFKKLTNKMISTIKKIASNTGEDVNYNELQRQFDNQYEQMCDQLDAAETFGDLRNM